jgi:hypothetical protein
VTQRGSIKPGSEFVRELGGIDLDTPPALRTYPALGLGHLLTRLQARVERSSLDAALARGADPCESRVLAHRAARLTSERTRKKMAARIEDIVARAGRAPSGKVVDVYSRAFSAAIEPDRDEVAAAGPLLMRVQELLLSSTPVYARGVALLEELLGQGDSSLYLPSSPGDLSHQLRRIIAALEGREHHERSTHG